MGVGISLAVFWRNIRLLPSLISQRWFHRPGPSCLAFLGSCHADLEIEIQPEESNISIVIHVEIRNHWLWSLVNTGEEKIGTWYFDMPCQMAYHSVGLEGPSLPRERPQSHRDCFQIHQPILAVRKSVQLQPFDSPPPAGKNPVVEQDLEIPLSCRGWDSDP